MLKLGKAPHPALVGMYELLGEQVAWGLGQDLFDAGAGGFETDTGSWVPYNNNTVEVSPDIAHSGSNSLKLTYVDSGFGAILYFRDSDDLFTNLTVGKKYRIVLWAAVNAGSSVDITLATEGVATITTKTVANTAMTKLVIDFVAQRDAFTYIRTDVASFGAGEILYIDDISIQEIEEGDLFDLESGGFETDIGSWFPVDNNAVEVSTDIAHSGTQSLKITYVDHSAGGQLYLRDADDLFSNLVVGRKYRLIFWTAINSGSAGWQLWDGSTWDTFSTITSTSMVRVEYDFIALHATECRLSATGMSAGEILYLDDITIQELYTPDMSGRANHGTVVDAVATPWGYSFDGADNNILVPDNPSLEPPNITILALVKSSGLVSLDRIVEKAASNVGYTLYTSGTTLTFVIGNTSGWSIITHGTAVTTDVEHWIAGTWDGVTQRIFLDLAEGNIATPSTPDLTGGGDLIIGNLSTGGQGWNGPIRKLYIYNQALTQREIREEMRRFKSSLKLAA